MKIYVRQRLDVAKGEKKPRFRVVAVAGEELHPYAGHQRKTELEQIAKDVGADVVYLEPMPEDSKRKEKVLAVPVCEISFVEETVLGGSGTLRGRRSA